MGLFGTRVGLVVDLFLALLVLLLPVLLVAVRLVRRGRVRAHATTMVVCFAVFLLAVIVFEVNVRVGDLPPPATVPFAIHMAFALPSLVLWIVQIALAKRAFLAPAPHRLRGKLLLALLCLTVATGTWLYIATFACDRG